MQDSPLGSNVSIRGLIVNGKSVVNRKIGSKDVTEDIFSDENVISPSANSDSTVIPMKAVHSNIGSSLSSFLLTTNYILPISLLSLLLLISMMVSVGVMRYLRMQKRSYYTQEDAGDTQAVDADTAVLQARTGHRVERRREWIL